MNPGTEGGWKTKGTERFILRWVKIHLSAPLSQVFVRLHPRVRPIWLTMFAACSGVAGGFAFGLGHAWAGGLLAALAQIVDGMDGQVARLTGRESRRGAFLDSALDRYMDFALLIGILLHCLRFSSHIEAGPVTLGPSWLIVIAGLAAVGASQVSYLTARASSLRLSYQRPELAGKGTRTAVIVIGGLLTPLWIHLPLLVLIYLAIHPNLAVLISVVRVCRSKEEDA